MPLRGPIKIAPSWLVVSAWAPELAELGRALPDLPAPIRKRLALGTVGVGLVDAAIGAARLAQRQRPRAIILVGTAGLYPDRTKRLALGDAVVADQIVLLSDVAPQGHAYLPEVMHRREKATPSLGQAIRRASGLGHANVACPLAITSSAAAARFAAASSGCAVENLEAFAVARVAASLKIPFTAVLGVANHVGPGAHREWKQNSAAAAAAACRALLAFLR